MTQATLYSRAFCGVGLLFNAEHSFHSRAGSTKLILSLSYRQESLRSKIWYAINRMSEIEACLKRSRFNTPLVTNGFGYFAESVL
jgi:hypothetical protein